MNKKLLNFLFFSLVIGYIPVGSAISLRDFYRPLVQGFFIGGGMFAFQTISLYFSEKSHKEEASQSAASQKNEKEVENAKKTEENKRVEADKTVEENKNKETRREAALKQLLDVQFSQKEMDKINTKFPGRRLFSAQNYLIEPHDLDNDDIVKIVLMYNAQQNQVDKKIYISGITADDVQKMRPSEAPIIGLDEILSTIEDSVQQIKKGRVVSGILLEGPPGVGKSLIAGAIAKKYGLTFAKFDNPNSPLSGEPQQKTREWFKVIRQHAPCVMLMDEVDTIAPKRDNEHEAVQQHKIEAVNALLQEMDPPDKAANKGLLFIGTTNRSDAIDDAIKRDPRFGVIISVPFPGERARNDMVLYYLRNKDYDIEKSYIETLAKKLSGCSGADIMGLVGRAAQLARIAKQSVNALHMDQAYNEIASKKNIIVDVLAKNNSQVLHDKAAKIARKVVLAKLYEKNYPYAIKEVSLVKDTYFTDKLRINRVDLTLFNYATTYVVNRMYHKQDDEDNVKGNCFKINMNHSKEFFNNEKFLNDYIYDVAEKHGMKDALDQQIKSMLKEADELLKKNEKVITGLAETLVKSEALNDNALKVFFEKNTLVNPLGNE